MDKQTLSHYGWIVIVVLVLAVMLAFATPFGTYVGDAVVATTKGFGSITEHNLNEDNIKNQGDKWEDKFENGVGGGTSEPETGVGGGTSEPETGESIKNVTISILHHDAVNGESKEYLTIQFKEGMTWGEWLENEPSAEGWRSVYHSTVNEYRILYNNGISPFGFTPEVDGGSVYVTKDEFIIDDDTAYFINIIGELEYTDEYIKNHGQHSGSTTP